MGSGPFSEIPCKLCSKPVDLTSDLSADENGKAVHSECYVRHIIGTLQSHRAIPSLATRSHSTSVPYLRLLGRLKASGIDRRVRLEEHISCSKPTSLAVSGCRFG
jgi:hypothetical protein